MSKPESGATLGIGGFLGHDANAALMVDGELVAATQEERSTRRKHDGEFPRRAIAECLEIGGLHAGEVGVVAFAEKHLQSRLFDKTGRPASRLSAAFARLLPNRWEAEYLKPARELFTSARIRYAWHHLSHAAGAFYTSDCRRAAFLCVDGKGEDVNATIGRIDADELEVAWEQPHENGIGLLYTLVTRFLGFPSFGSEYKVMGLAPYGEPRFVEGLRSLVHSDPRGWVRLKEPVTFVTPAMEAAVALVERATGVARRGRGEELTDEHVDIAASLQSLFEERIFAMARFARETTEEDHLLFTGGCAQNCVVAGKLRAAGIFSEVHNSPVAGDMGSGLGAAILDQRDRGLIDGAWVDPRGFYLGTSPGEAPLEATPWAVDSGDDLFAAVAARLAEGSIVAWCRGRMELGARALGARSIFADPRVPGMQSRLNRAVKFREGFRPFAPVVLEEEVGAWFDSDRPSRFMQFVANLRPELRRAVPAGLRSMRERLEYPRCEISSVIHVDYSARLQTVEAGTHPDLHRLLSAFHRSTGVPILINTSFNVAGEPIVRTAQEAWDCFVHTDVDFLVIGDRMFRNPRQLGRSEKLAWAQRFTEFS
ncbi:MAG: carbamoyltransferase C-terminal domain-containing protein [Thermoanaerobaculia bacterium]